jgi:hypothetical protein
MLAFLMKNWPTLLLERRMSFSLKATTVKLRERYIGMPYSSYFERKTNTITKVVVDFPRVSRHFVYNCEGGKEEGGVSHAYKLGNTPVA